MKHRYSKLLFLLFVLAIMAFPFMSLEVWADEFILMEEDFEEGFSDGWTVSPDNSDYKWNVGTGDYYGSTGAHSGSQNARITTKGGGYSSSLISPTIDLTGIPYVRVSFWYINRDWQGDIDPLFVCCRMADGSEIELFYTNVNHENWTNAYRTIAIPEKLQTDGVQLLFQATDNYGYGIGLDDICVTELTEVLHATVSYDANGGSGEMEDQISIESQPLSVSSNGFVGTYGYDFIGWNTASDGSGTSYLPGDSITPQEDMVLYAQWQECLVLSYDANGGSGEMANQNTFGEPLRVSANGFDTPENCGFFRWDTAPDGSGISYKPGDEITLEEDTVLYAQWQYSVFDETFDKGSLEGWTFIDANEDQHGWDHNNYWGRPHSGTYYLSSASYINGSDYDYIEGAPIGIVEPDNWAITPAILLPEDAVLSFWIRGQDESYAAEHMAVLIGDNPEIDGMVQLGEDYIATEEYVQYEIDLSQYAGQTKYIAFRHYNTYDMFRLNLEDVQIFGARPAEEMQPEFTTNSLVLSGQIGENFTMSIPEKYIDGTMTFKVGNRTVEAAGVPTGDGKYRFTCLVNSVEMAEPIVAAYTYMDGEEEKVVTKESSVKEYVENLVGIADREDTGEETNEEMSLREACRKAEPLAKAIYNFGYYAMKSLLGGKDHPAMPDTYAEELDLQPTVDERYRIAFQNDGGEIAKASFSLDLDSETTINFYLTIDDALADSIKVTSDVDSYELSVNKVGKRYKVQIIGINALELGSPFTVEVGSSSITGSALSYVYSCLANAKASEESKNTAAALYAYYQEVVNYSAS